MNLKDAGIYDMINIFKGEATKAHGASQGGVINNKPRLINIPAYQRPYRWKTDRIVRLFCDYDENNEEHTIQGLNSATTTVEEALAAGSFSTGNHLAFFTMTSLDADQTMITTGMYTPDIMS